MMGRPSYWTSFLTAAVLLVPLVGGTARGAAAQTEVDGLCAPAAAGLECNLAAAAAVSVQPRIGLALWGGNPVPGTASTLGFRIGTTPRLAVAVRAAVVPTAVPPFLDRNESTSSTAAVTAISIQSSLALLHGASPLPTVGGLLSLDLVGRFSFAHLPRGAGFDGSAWGVGAGLRLGVLRESFTLPGLSLTALYGLGSRVTLGDPEGLATDGAITGGVAGLSATAAVSRRILGLRLTGGIGWNRYTSRATLRYAGAPAGPTADVTGDLVMERWSGFASLTWTRLVYHTVLEVGWQQPPDLPVLPVGTEIRPMTWWAALAFRVTA